MLSRNATLDDLLEEFVNGVHDTVRRDHKTPVVWEEMVLNHELNLGKDTIVTVWISSVSTGAYFAKSHLTICLSALRRTYAQSRNKVIPSFTPREFAHSDEKGLVPLETHILEFPVGATICTSTVSAFRQKCPAKTHRRRTIRRRRGMAGELTRRTVLVRVSPARRCARFCQTPLTTAYCH